MSEESRAFPKFTEIKYNDLPKTPGVYWLTFSNGKCYLGHAVNLQQRVEQHFKELMKEDDYVSNWYQICRLENKRDYKGTWRKWSFFTFLVHTTTIKIVQCPTKTAAAQLEKQALTILKADGKDEHYYNSEYYTKEGRRIVQQKKKMEPTFGEIPQTFEKQFKPKQPSLTCWEYRQKLYKRKKLW